MDPFALIMLGIVVSLVVAVLLLGRYHPMSGSEVLDWKPVRSPELEAQNELDDLDQMLEAANERRRRRGEPELTEDAVQASVRREQRERSARAQAYRAREDTGEMLAAANERRRRRGQPELTDSELRARVRRGE